MRKLLYIPISFLQAAVAEAPAQLFPLIPSCGHKPIFCPPPNSIMRLSEIPNGTVITFSCLEMGEICKKIYLHACNLQLHDEPRSHEIYPGETLIIFCQLLYIFFSEESSHSYSQNYFSLRSCKLLISAFQILH